MNDNPTPAEIAENRIQQLKKEIDGRWNQNEILEAEVRKAAEAVAENRIALERAAGELASLTGLSADTIYKMSAIFNPPYSDEEHV